MEETCDESGRLDLNLAGARDENKLEMALGETSAVVDERVISGSAQKTSEADAEDTEAQSCGGSYQNRMDGEQRDADHSSTLVALHVAEDAAPAADVLVRDSSEAPSADGGAPVVHECHRGDEPHHPNDQTDAERQMHCQRMYHMVFNQMLQQQKHRPGRRFKKKTLIKMAKLFVIAKGWDSEGNRALNVAEMLHHKDLLAAIVSQTELNPAEGGRGETLSSMTLNTTDSKETEKQKPDCNMSRESRLQAEPDKSDIGSASAREETKSTCDDRELPRNEAAETSGVKTSKQRKRTAKPPEAGGNRRAKRKPSDKSSATNDVRQDGGLAPKNEEEPRENQRQRDKIDPKVKKKPGRRIRKETMIPTGMESESGGKQKKKNKTASLRSIQSAETAAEAGRESGGNLDNLSRITEDETQPLDEVQKRRRKRTKPSVSQQAAQQLTTRYVSLQEQPKTTQSSTAASPAASPAASLAAASPAAASLAAASPAAASPAAASPAATSPAAASPAAASPTASPEQTKPAVNEKKHRGKRTTASVSLQAAHQLPTGDVALQAQNEATPPPAAVLAVVASPNQAKPGDDTTKSRRKRNTSSVSLQAAHQLTTGDVSMQEQNEDPASPEQTKPADNGKKRRGRKATASASLQVVHQLTTRHTSLHEQIEAIPSPPAASATIARPAIVPPTVAPPAAAPPNQTKPGRDIKKRRRKRTTASVSKQTASQLTTTDVSLQEQSESTQSPPAASPTTTSPKESLHRTKPADNGKRCRAKRTTASVLLQVPHQLTLGDVLLQEQNEVTPSPTVAPPTTKKRRRKRTTASVSKQTASQLTTTDVLLQKQSEAPQSHAAASPTATSPKESSPHEPKPDHNRKKCRGKRTTASVSLQAARQLTLGDVLLQEQNEITPSPTAAPPTVAPPTVSPPTAAPPTAVLPSIAPPTISPPTAPPPTIVPPTAAPPTIVLPTVAPPTAVPPTVAPPTAPPPTIVPPTISPPTAAPPTIVLPTVALPAAVPPTISPPTAPPPTIVLPTAAPPTIVLPTVAPPTAPPLTIVRPTVAPPTAPPPTIVPPTAAPPTAPPPTIVPPTVAPPTAPPLTIVRPTVAPPTAPPPTIVPPTAASPTIKKRGRKRATSSVSLQAAHQLTAADEATQPRATASPTESPHQTKPADNTNVKEEFHVPWAASGLKQEEDERSIAIVKKRGRRRKKDGAAEKNELKSEPSWDAGAYPVIDVRRELVHRQAQTRAFRKRKKQKYVDEDTSQASTQAYELPLTAGVGAEGHLDTSISGHPKQKRRKKVKTEVHNMSLENLQNTEVESSRYKKLRERKVTSGSSVTTVPEEYLIRYLKGSRKRSAVKRYDMANASDNLSDEQETPGISTDDAPKPEDTSKRRYIRKGWTRRGRQNLPADVEANVGLPGEVATSSLQENASRNMKDKRKRAKRKMKLEPSGPMIDEAVRCPLNPPSNLPREVTLRITKRRGRPKRELKNSTSGGQTESTPEIPNTRISAVAGRRRGRRWLTRGAKPSVDATATMEEVTSGPKGVPEVAFELDCKTSTKTNKGTTLTAGKNLQRKCDAGAVGDQETCKTSNIQDERRKREAVTIKAEDAAACLIDHKQTPDEFEASEVTCSFQNKSNIPESVPSAPPAKKTIKKRRRRSRTHWVGQKKVKRHQIGSVCMETSPLDSSLCESASAGETIDLRLGDWQQEAAVSQSEARNRPHQTPKSSKKNLRCRFCRRCFRHISAFTLHKRIHTGEKPFRCPTCGKTFSKLLQLKQHSKVHGQPPTMHCPCCGVMFRSKAELILHFKTHLNSQTQTQSEGRFWAASSGSEAFRCSVCLKEFTKTDAFKKHQQIHGGKRRRNLHKTSSLSFHQKTPQPVQPHSFQKLQDLKSRSEVGSGPTPPSSSTAPSHVHQTTAFCSGRTVKDGSLAPQSAETTAVVLKCPICKEQHHHWCNYVQHLQIHRCKACRQGGGQEGGQAAENGLRPNQACEKREVRTPSSHSRLSVNSDTSAASLSSGGPAQQTPKLVLSGRSGKSFTAWNKLQLHRRLRGRAGRPFCCSQCELEFRFLGSYVDHLQEHATQTPHADPSCPDACAGLQSSSRRQLQDCLRCSTCGKRFSSPTNLQRHKLLHKGAKSHVCLPCGLAFSCHAALTSHLETHRKRISAPLPAPVSEPLLFPYHCRKCTAEFSSAELLQAHQVCHFPAGKQPGSPPETAPSFVPSGAPAGVQEGAPGTSQRPLQLPVSSKKHLFRYPHPDRLYVVPIMSSEPPVVVSDTEEENLHKAAPAGDPSGSPLRKPGVSVNPDCSGALRFSNICGLGADGSLQLQRLVQSLLPERCSNVTDSSDGESDAVERAPPKDGVNACTMCSACFADVSQLHAHYVDHARGV